MSLIQEALSKAQTKVRQDVSPKAPAPAQAPKRRFSGLQDLDHEVEQKIQQVQARPFAQKKKSYFSLAVFFVLGAVVAFGVFYWLALRPQSQTELPRVVDIQKSRFVSKPELALPAAAPTGTLDPIEALQERIHVGGIVLGGDRPYALLNGEILREGEAVEENVILSKIDKEYVTLNYQGQPVQIKIRR